MTDVIQIKLTGDRDVRAALADLKDYLPKNVLLKSVRAAAKSLDQFVALVAPKLTGNLARNIVVRTRRTAQTVRARVTVNTEGKAGGPLNAFYWRFLEEGWHDRAGKAHKLPFVVNVFDQRNQAAAQMVIDSVGAAIDRAEAKAKR